MSLLFMGQGLRLAGTCVAQTSLEAVRSTRVSSSFIGRFAPARPAGLGYTVH